MGRRRTYTLGELAEVAAGIRRILVSIESGDLVADTRTVTRLEGAAAALEALAEGQSVT